ncbi:hypothetical protein NIES970_11250 [[Synechococcus] sp. NIES-970]|uniref:HpsJ family protein n=1 Tax=Picosynechococcus sp. NKBG15041c TaxID=1407650 RepID=UPI0004071A8F|nr:HpsJ family protein [Picosynechococcus sp. NKBG15041c]BAW96201.1 hypothetical protein NIES970_11250 [[Synechococcus] sp. NIES-970]
MNNVRFASFTSLTLRVLGAILLISSLVDYVVVAFPWMPLNDAWQINFTNQVVGKGINPLIGIVALLLGSWLEANAGKKEAKLRVSITDGRFLSFIFALILGVIFLVLIPVHLNNLQGLRQEAIARIEQESQQQEQEVQAQFSQLQALAQDPEAQQELDQQLQQIDAALNSGQIPPQQIAQAEAQREQLNRFKDLAADPDALNARLEELQRGVVEAQAEERGRATRNMIQEILQTGVRSLLLGLGYLLVGWFGIQNARTNTGGTPTPTASETPVDPE